MLRKLRNRIQSEEKGFTLVELLVVIIIIGILAAIAIPAFLGQRSKGQDAQAKSDVRNAVSQVESCYTDKVPQTYEACPTRVPSVTLTVGTPTAYTLSRTSSSGTTFTVSKDATTNTTTRACTAAETGGCLTGGTW